MCIGDFCGFNEGYEIEMMASDQSVVPSTLSPQRKGGGGDARKWSSPGNSSPNDRSPNKEPSVEEMLGPEFATTNKNRFGGGNDDHEGPKGPGEASYVITYR